MEVIINNFNRCKTLKNLIDWLKKAEMVDKITILDNNSTYEKTLDLYKTLDVNIVYFKENLGHLAPLKYLESFQSNIPFVVSDPDLDPQNTPVDLIPRCLEINRIHKTRKTGPSISLDIPDHYYLKERIKNWCLKIRIGETLGYDGWFSPVDTTFAVYETKESFGRTDNSILLKEPYVFRHPDWEVDILNLDQEYSNYLMTSNTSASFTTSLKRYLPFCDKYSVDPLFFIGKRLNFDGGGYISFLGRRSCILNDNIQYWRPLSDKCFQVVCNSPISDLPILTLERKSTTLWSGLYDTNSGVSSISWSGILSKI